MSFKLPDLPYDYKALEPYIDEKTMIIHHDKHHGTYVTNLNKALEGTEYASWPIDKLLAGLSGLPESVRTAVRNNGGGHANHTLFWQVLGPGGGGEPGGKLAGALTAAFGSFAGLKEKLSAAALSRFGSGWAWLVVKKDKSPAVYSTANQDSPVTEGDVPILGLDVWEHAYYLLYQNRRADYIAGFFNVVNWKEVEKRYEAALSA
jgi:Fe-Mn family superoxide dismutase